ncbi:hypothetical protein SAMN04489760_10743 [Syntrophus gentianae]|uniref:Uncharacterized protein n=1 Tax=Syntrophus gentianae TaxID=43775 RepID=A0A1H7WMB8_9BACT|nr:hypothetical protein [Syntrophus gentianae]SEM22660.1 hypothetical protein SAMN04489760_10743 [Syntrophus gentianae]
MFKYVFSSFVVLSLLIPVFASAIAPPEAIARRNLEADLIVIGVVKSIHADNTIPHFVLEVRHTVKGLERVKPEDTIRILMSNRQVKTGKVRRHSQGQLPIRVKEKSLVVVYVNRSDSSTGYFRPLLEGSSVITIYPVMSEER